MKIFITKYALTRGVLQVNGTIVHHGSKAYARWGHRFTREWCGTLAEAQRVAEQMRLAKIASLKKQLAKLEAKTFTVVKAKS